MLLSRIHEAMSRMTATVMAERIHMESLYPAIKDSGEDVVSKTFRKIVRTMAILITPAAFCTDHNTPVAVPAKWWGADAIAVAVVGVRAIPHPIPSKIRGARTK